MQLPTIKKFLIQEGIINKDGMVNLTKPIELQVVLKLMKAYAEKTRDHQIILSAVGAAHETAAARGTKSQLNNDFQAHKKVCKVKIETGWTL